MTLLRPVRQKGRTFLQSVGFDTRQSSYKVFGILDDHYGSEKKSLLKQKFVLVSQLASEDDRNYLARVERLSRGAGFDNSDAWRKHYCFVLAINGLRDTNL